MSNVKNTIKTTGELRQFLINMMVGVKDGHVDVQKASQLTKLAGQINESIYAEIKTSRLLLDMEQKVQQFGSLSINDDSKNS